MLKYLLVLLLGFGIYTTSFAQCYQGEVYKAAEKGRPAIYLRDFNRRLDKNASTSATIDLKGNSLYRFIHYNNLTSYFELRDENNTLIRSTFTQDSVYATLDFLPQQNSTYNLIFYNKTDNLICSATILSFLGKHSNFIGLSADTSLLASGKYLDLSCRYAASLPDLSKYGNDTEVLDISFNNFRELPSEISRFQQLKKLSLSGNSYLDVNQALENITNPANIEVLDLSSIYFREFPKELNRFSNLKRLSLVHSRFALSTNLGDVFLLESLDELSIEPYLFRKIKIPELTKSNLKMLNLEGNNNYADIKNLLKALPELEHMNLPGTTLKASKIDKLRKRYPNVKITSRTEQSE